MTLETIRLSVEELALAMNLIGQPEVAKNIMVTQLGPLSQEIAHARLIAAGHSLMARDWLAMDINGKMHLADGLVRIVEVLAHADFSIRYSKSYPDADLTLTFHFAKGKIFEHRLESGVLHSITEIEDKTNVLQTGIMFFDLSKSVDFTCPPVGVSNNLLEEVKREAQVSVIQDKLEQEGVPKLVSQIFANDLANKKYFGSILRIEYGAGSVPTSDRGLLVLRGPERLWLLRPEQQDGNVYAALLSGDRPTFMSEVASLF